MERNINRPEFPEFQVDYEAYRRAIERVLPEIPVENGAIDIDSIWVETSLPRDLIIEIVQAGGLQLPPNVERIVLRRERSWALPGSGAKRTRKTRPAASGAKRQKQKQREQRKRSSRPKNGNSGPSAQGKSRKPRRRG